MMGAEYKQLTSRKAVLRAIAECDRLGIEAFRERYGFDPAKQYVLRHGGRIYDSKAIVGVAYGYQFPDAGPLTSDRFSGGKTQAGRHLSRLGFEVDGIAPSADDWTLAEVETIVATYFEMFAAQAEGTYDRRQYLSQALAKLPRRNDGAVGWKLSNLSAVLELLDLPILRGFGPLGNKQTLLTAVVYDWLEDHPEIFDGTPKEPTRLTETVEVPPPDSLMLRTVGGERRGCKVDFADRDARNRQLGKLGEAWALAYLTAELAAAGRADLADQVVWASQAVGDGLGYDIAAFTVDGQPLAVEVKTTNGGIAAPFLVTANEVAASSAAGETYVLMRVFNFASAPQFYRLPGALERTCRLRPRTFAALPLSSADLDASRGDNEHHRAA